MFAASFVAAAHAEPDAFDFRVADVGLLQVKQVQTDIGITAAQRAKMNKAADAHRARLIAYQKELQSTGGRPDQGRVTGFLRTLKTEVLANLSASQLRRLRELTLQRLGTAALVDDAVSLRVGLSREQVAKLRETFQNGRGKFVMLQQKTAEPILAPYRKSNPKTDAEKAALRKELSGKLKAAGDKLKPQLLAIGKETDAAMLKILTPKQKATWAALKGKPFKG